MKGLLQRIFHIGAGSPKLDYEESKRLIQSRNPADRRLVAGNLQVQPEVLYFLATDLRPYGPDRRRETRRPRFRPT